MLEKIDLTEVHSEDVQDIVGRAPKWVVRRGIVVIACIVSLLLLGAWFIKYPEVVSAPVSITSSPPPVKLVTRSAGRIAAIAVRDKEQVAVHQVVAVIDNPAVTKDMFYLKAIAELLDTTPDLHKSIAGITLPGNIQVGAVQPDYAVLYRALGQGKNRAEEAATLPVIRDAAKRIRGQVAIWESRYVLRSPVKGVVNFFHIRRENQYVAANETVFIVVPAAREYTVQMQLPVYNAGKIRVGQPVLIKLHEYPFIEFGMLKATVETLSNVALDSAYSVQLKLTEGLRTTKNQVIPQRPEISGKADIIIRDKNILQRVFEKADGDVQAE